MTQDKKTILFILPWLPYPLCSGGHQGIFNGIKATCDNFNIIISYPEAFETNSEKERNEFVKELGGTVTISPYKLPPISPAPKIKLKTRIHRWIRRIYSCPQAPKPKPEYHEWPFQLLPIDKSYTQHILSLIEQYNVSIVQCEMLENAPFIYILPDNIIRIFVHHELRFVRHALTIKESAENYLEMLAFQKNAMACEIGTLNQFDAVITVSQTDADKLANAGLHAQIFPSISVVNSPILPVYTNCKKRKKLSFIGPSNHKPNLHGLQWFLSNCWDYLANEEYQLQIIGDWENTTIQEICQKHSNITFLGYVKDLTTVLQGTIMIVPINIGSGIRMKILEASAIGIPIVSTKIGAEGLPFVNNIHCLIADSPSDFIEAIERLQNEELCSKLIKNAQTEIKNNYSFETLRKNRLEIYNQLLKQRGEHNNQIK